MTGAQFTYTSAFQENREWIDEHSQRCLLAAFAHLGIPKRMLDIGCGTGRLVETACSLGAYAVGVDIALPEGERLLSNGRLLERDLSAPLILSERELGHHAEGFDLVVCLETAEHIPEPSAQTFCGNLARHLSNWLIFTAAHPGQKGVGHVNEQPPSYWRRRLEVCGLGFERGKTEELRSTWLRACGPCWWLPRNLQVFSCTR